ncbi:helix-turn-helix transcriptional regulator [Sodalis sp. RH24]|uniref:helix-turn-helix transcriptional regulator n=1 Tax=unclassified Sodalis (in: enterobacteria) TaxID=2636512 RepID=UPI0039B496C8
MTRENRLFASDEKYALSSEQFSWSGFYGSSTSRNNLVSVAYPQLRVEQSTPSFFFFEPTVLIVLAGRIEFLASGENHTLADKAAVGFIDQGVIADYTKYPPSNDSPFRSIFLTFSADVLEYFYQFFQGDISSAKKKPQFTTVDLNSALHESLRTLLKNLDQPSLSDARIRLRIFDLLLVLAEQNIHFTLPQRQGVFPRLSHLLRASPEIGWTARSAGEALAMSESTLRRRLREEGIRFEKLLVDIRMHHGLLLIQTTNWNMTQVADACGYKSVSRFAERFTQRFGLSPSRLR